MTDYDSHLATTDVQSPADDPPRGLRPLIDAAVCLALAVILFRAFQVEGYMISTGSMAPTLLGFHKRVVCPSCRFPFAVGDVTDEPLGQQSAANDEEDSVWPRRESTVLAVCPNCGAGPIDVAAVPRSQGDQLLVHKHAFLLVPPRRWEVAVFRNPYKPDQAYVKRVVGLPGESVQIAGGDVYVNGEIRRKSLALQRAVRVPVFDDSFRPDDEGWRSRWAALPARHPWTETTDGFHVYADKRDATGADIQEPAWVQYRHWVRSEQSAEPPRLAPVTDDYGYNRVDDVAAEHAVRDLMLSARVTIRRGEGEFLVQMTDGEQTVLCVIDPAQREVRLLADGPARTVRSAPLAADLLEEGRTLHLEFSLFDRQALLAIDGRLPFEPWPLPATRGSSSPPTSPVRFGARGLAVEVTHLKLYRDVYYTRGKGVNAIEEPYQLAHDEYFVLGDNSPVSLDARSWPDGALNSRLFIGKPFLVHLPSKPAKIRFGQREAWFRIPDFPQIRYIR